MLGSGILVVGFVIALVLGVWAIFFELSVIASQYPGLNSTTASNSVNASQILQAETGAEAQFASVVDIPGLIDAILEAIGIVLFGLGIAAYGKRYNNTPVTRYSYYATALMAVGFLTSLVTVPIGFPNVFTVILTIVGAVIFAFAIRKLSADARYNNLAYYGYGIAIGALLGLLGPLGSAALIVVFILFIFAFRNLRKGSGENPFETNPGAMVTKATAQGQGKRNKKQQVN